jgi:hypothetical protein
MADSMAGNRKIYEEAGYIPFFLVKAVCIPHLHLALAMGWLSAGIS